VREIYSQCGSTLAQRPAQQRVRPHLQQHRALGHRRSRVGEQHAPAECSHLCAHRRQLSDCQSPVPELSMRALLPVCMQKQNPKPLYAYAQSLLPSADPTPMQPGSAKAHRLPSPQPSQPWPACTRRNGNSESTHGRRRSSELLQGRCSSGQRWTTATLASARAARAGRAPALRGMLEACVREFQASRATVTA